MGLFSKEKQTINPLDSYTPEQRQAIQILQSIANTGSGGGINLGEAYGGSLGNYNLTDLEKQSQQSLSQSLSGNNPYQKQAAGVYSDLANSSFNPTDPSSGFAAFSRQVARSTNQANDVLNREGAITGGRFGTGILKQKADLAFQQSDSLQSALAQLFQQSQSNRLAGANGLQSLFSQQQNSANSPLLSLQRDLMNQQAQAQYSEYQRQQNDKNQRLQLLQNTTQLGLAPYSVSSPSLFSQLLNVGLGAAGTAAGAAIGGPIGASIGNRIGSGIGNTLSGSQLQDLFNPQFRYAGAGNGSSYNTIFTGR